MGEEEMAKRKIVDRAKSLGYYLEANSELMSYSKMVGLVIKSMLGVLSLPDMGKRNILRNALQNYIEEGKEEERDEDKGEWYGGE
jgi:hypothetical protein